MRSLAILMVLLAGCGTVERAAAPWTVIASEGPWTAPGQQAVLESKEYWASPMAAGAASVRRFLAHDGRAADADREVRRLFDFSEKNGTMQTLRETDGSIDGRRVVLAPYRFHVVSVFPFVAILSAHDFGPVRNRSNYELVGERPKGALSDDRILNHVEIGTEFPAENELYWMSAELRVPITRLARDPQGGFEIRHPNVVLVGRMVGNSIVVERKQ